MPRKSDRMDPLSTEHWPASLDAVRETLGAPLNVHKMMANHPELLAAWLPLRQHLVTAGSLSERQRELAVLRTAVGTGTDYEWRHHVLRGRRAGLSEAEIARVRELPAAGGWERSEQLLLEAVDGLIRRFEISESVRQELARHLSAPQLLDLIATVGMYMTLAGIIKTCGVALEADLEAGAQA